MDLLLHPHTEKRLAPIVKSLPHGLLLTGKSGVGLLSVARFIAGNDMADVIAPVDSKGDENHDTGTINVATIRELYEHSRAKSTRRQVFIVDDAERMSPGAQAAFLKLLEEPTASTHFILTSHAPNLLLPTVRSRVQEARIDPVSAEQTSALIAQLGIGDKTKKLQLEFLGLGLPAEIMRLTRDDAHFAEQAEVMADTRIFLSGTPYQKLLVVHKYHQSKQKALRLLDAALAISERSLAARPQDSLVHQLARLVETKEKIAANCNVRLQLLAFVVY